MRRGGEEGRLGGREQRLLLVWGTFGRRTISCLALNALQNFEWLIIFYFVVCYGLKTRSMRILAQRLVR